MKHINNVPVEPEMYERIRENTTKEQWQKLLLALQINLLTRIVSTPDADLPRLKGKVEFMGELNNFFLEIFS